MARHASWLLIAAASVIITSAAAAQSAGAPPTPPAPTARPTFEADGTVNVPAFRLPASPFLSPEARAEQDARARAPSFNPSVADATIEERRAEVDRMMGGRIAAMRARYPVDVVETTIAGVPVRIITPTDKTVDPERVLVNLHGGGFTMCWGACSLLESIPLASVGGYRVVSVNYRMGPEAAHPAGVEDAAKVYAELLKTYEAGHVGVYGCSAGGSLTAQLAAWLPVHDMPQPGAVGIFGAGGVRMLYGDSAHVAAYIDGSFPAPPPPGTPAFDMTRGYFADADMDDAVLSPALHPDVIARFPPTLLITGTRAMDMTPAVVTNSRLLQAGVESTLVVEEGMGHCYIYNSDLPEARAAYDIAVRFFREHLD